MKQLLFALLAILVFVRSARIFPIRDSKLLNVPKLAVSNEAVHESAEVMKTLRNGTFWKIIYEAFSYEGVQETCPDLLKCLRKAYAQIRVYYMLITIEELCFFSTWKLVVDVLSNVNKEMMKAVCAAIPKHETKDDRRSGDLYAKLFRLHISWTSYYIMVKSDIDRIIDLLPSIPNHDERSNIYTDDLSSVFDIIATNVESDWDFNSWSINLEDAFVSHFDQIYKIYNSPNSPCDGDRDTILLLAQLEFKFEEPMRQFCFQLIAREAQFLVICQMDQTQSSYFSKKKAMKIPSIETHPMKAITAIKSAFQVFAAVSNNIAPTMGLYWEKLGTLELDDRKLQALLLIAGLESFRDMLHGASELVLLAKPKQSLLELRRVLLITFQMLSVANKTLYSAIEMDLDKNIKVSIAKYLSDEKGNRGTNNQMFLTIYSMLEGQICQLFPKDPFLATVFFRIIELCRSFIGLADLLNDVPDVKEYLDTPFLALTLLTETQGFIIETFTTHKEAVCSVSYDLALNFVKSIRGVFGNLFAPETVVEEMDIAHYAYLERRVLEEKDDKFWKKVSEKIKASRSKSKEPAKETKKPKKKNTPKVPTKLAKKSRLVSSTSRNVITNKSSEINSEPTICTRVDSHELIVKNTVRETQKINEEKQLVSVKTRNADKSIEQIKTHTPKFRTTNEHNKIPSIWSEAGHKLIPTFKNYFAISPMIAVQPRALEYRPIRKYEEPSHHLALAKDLGYKKSDIDPSDFLMALILIGQRVWIKKLEPLLNVLQTYETQYHLVQTFFSSIDDFKIELRMLEEMEPSAFNSILKDANIANSSSLYTYLKFYMKRLAICHPTVPRSATLKKNIQARNFTVLETYSSVQKTVIRKLRNSTESYDEIFIRSIEANGRPDTFLSIEHTEVALAVIGAHEMCPTDVLAADRNKYAHQEVTDSMFEAYMTSVLSGSKHFKLLSSL